MDEQFRTRLATALEAEVTAVAELSGGYVGTVYRVECADGSVLAAKTGETPLELEARMLAFLAAESPLPVPAVYHADSDLLVMEFVDGDGTWTAATQRDVADHVAALHGCGSDAYGFSFETLSGPYRQPNHWTDSWIEFFRDRRLLHFAALAHEEGALPWGTLQRIRTLCDRLDAWLVEPEAPSLLHGDLWAGNLVVGGESLRAALDPAVYFGHDELELAYVERTSELGDPFFERYRDRRGISDGYERRRPVYEAFHTLENVRFFRTDDRVATLRSQLDALGV